MTFHGRPDSPKPAHPLRTWRINGGERTISAHYLNWGTGHVLFWEDRPDGTPDHLVLAIANGDARTVEEVAPVKLDGVRAAEYLAGMAASDAAADRAKLVKRPATLDEDLHALDDGGR